MERGVGKEAGKERGKLFEIAPRNILLNMYKKRPILSGAFNFKNYFCKLSKNLCRK